MAKCDEGYPCQVCGKYVEDILESDLYLRYIIGQVDPELLHATPDRHIRCNPVMAQFIVAQDFEPVDVTGDFAKDHLDPDYVAAQEGLLSRGWQRLQQIKTLPEISVLDIPLPEVAAEFQRRFG